MSFSDRLQNLLHTVQAVAESKVRKTAGKARPYYQYDLANDQSAPPPPPPLFEDPSAAPAADAKGPVESAELTPKPVDDGLARTLRAQIRDPNLLRSAIIWREILDRPVSLRPGRGRRVR